MSAPSDGAGPAASSSDAGAADGSGAAGAASGSSDAEMVMRGGQMKKAFAPNLAAAGRKAKGKAQQPEQPPTESSSSAARGRGGRGQAHRGGAGRKGRGHPTYSQPEGFFSAGFGGEPPAPTKAPRQAPRALADPRSGGSGSGSGGGSGSATVKREPTDGGAASAQEKSRAASAAKKKAAGKGVAKEEWEDMDDDDGYVDGVPTLGIHDSVATLFPHVPTEFLPVKLPLGAGSSSESAVHAHDDVTTFPSPPLGESKFVFLQLPTVAIAPATVPATPDVKSPGGIWSAPTTPGSALGDDSYGYDGGGAEDEVPELAKVLEGRPDGLVGRLRIRKSGRAELVIGRDVYRFQRGTTVDCVQEVAAVRPDEGKLVCMGAVAPEHRYLVVRDLESAVAELRLESTADRGAAA